jgi:membrane-associated phospholipid phosphatase
MSDNGWRGGRRALMLGGAGCAAWALAPAAWAQGFRGGTREAFGNRYTPDGSGRQRIRQARALAMDALREWHEVALECTGIDHTPVPPGGARVFGEQFGPGRASRAMAIVHIAMFDALNSLEPRYRAFAGVPRAPRGGSPEAAIAQAAHDTLGSLFPSQRADLAEALAQDLSAVRDIAARGRGVDAGRRAADAILALRDDDGSAHAEPRIGVDFVPSSEPGRWRPDPVSRIPIALGARWHTVRPFVMRSADQFRVPPPPALDGAAFAAAFDEVRRLGGDGTTTPTSRTGEQAQIGIYWAYDGMPSLCAPPRLYNQIALLIATRSRTGPLELARLLALVNIAMADAGIAIWESKYHYQFCRPVTGIRELDGGRLVGDPTFTPLGAPASNLNGPNFTPPFPAYPSGHAGFGAALFQVLREFYRTDRIPFGFVSDEMNGVTTDSAGNVRPLAPRRFARLSLAEEENGQSRIYLGIHWSFDKTEGIAQGRRIASHVMDRALQPA